MSKQASFVRALGSTLRSRLEEPRRFIQAVAGARQVGKTTLVHQVTEDCAIPTRYASADDPALRGREWIEQQWQAARLEAHAAGKLGIVLVLDEIQKVQGWSETVKRLWDEDTRALREVKVVLLGSAPLQIQRGLSESLAGRFEVIHLPHWSLSEMQAAFGCGLEQFLFYGGYPGAAPLIGDPQRWTRYIKDSLIETTISRDVLLLTRVDKPALLRRLFDLGCRYSGQILSYTKMLGQLHDAGNTTTLAHYLDLLSAAGMLTGLGKYAGHEVRRRGSSPKLQVLNTALMTVQQGLSFDQLRADRELWGNLVESAVGAHLANAAAAGICDLHYWLDRGREVDFVVAAGPRLIALEVTSSRSRGTRRGLSAFTGSFKPARTLLVGGDGIPLEEFLGRPVEHWVSYACRPPSRTPGLRN